MTLSIRAADSEASPSHNSPMITVEPCDFRPTIVIDPANLDPAFGRLALVLCGTLEHLLGPEHVAVPQLFLKRGCNKSTPVIVRRCADGLEIVPVTSQFFALCIVPRVAKIERLDRGVRKADVLSVAEATMFFASRHAQLLQVITEWGGTLHSLSAPRPPGIVSPPWLPAMGWNLFFRTRYLTFAGEPQPQPFSIELLERQ